MVNLSTILSVKKDNSSKRAQCSNCSCYKNIFVPSYIGDRDIVIVGELPCFEDAKLGIPFSGESGKLLRKVLQEVGFNHEKVTYINTCKCCPSDNEIPNKEVYKSCSSLFLWNEIKEINPKLIVLAGATALNQFFPDESIMNKAGNFLKSTSNSFTYLPILHPAYCLRNPASTPRLRKDLKKAYQFLNGGISSDKEYEVITDIKRLQEVRSILLSKDLLSFDVETNGKLDVFDTHLQLWSIGFSFKRKQGFSIPLDHPENVNIEFKQMCWKVSKEILASNVRKIAQNAGFDIKICKKFNLLVNNFYADTMVMSFLLDENRYSLGLKQLASEYLDGCTYAWSDKLKDLGIYNCEDCDNTIGLYDIFIKELEKHPVLLNLFTSVLMPMILVIVDMELDGIHIDQKLSNKLAKDLNNKLETIKETIGDKFPESKGVNLSSNKQLRELLFDKLKYPHSKLTESKQISTDSEVLENLSRKGYKLATYLLKIRKYEKLLSTYVEKLTEIIKYDGRVHGDFNICGARTGRISSSNPNMQNIPRDKLVKQMFTASNDNNILFSMDFSQAELRVAASIANESNMIMAYQNNIDIHTLTASQILNIAMDKVTSEDRQKAKGVNFGFVYGQSAEGFQRTAKNDYNLDLSLDTCIDFRNRYFLTYPGLLVWYEQVRKELQKYGHVEYPTGRFRRFPEVKGLSKIPDEIFRKGVNSPVQGSSSDIVLFSMVCLKNVFTKLHINARIILTVHDSIILDCSPKDIDDIIAEVNNICKFSIPKQFTWLKVPMKFDFMQGHNWGELTKIS